MSSFESKEQYLVELKQELEHERNQSWQHCKYFMENRNTEEDLKIGVIKKRWEEYAPLVDELIETLILHNVKVQTKDHDIVLRDVIDDSEIYYLYMTEKPIKLIPRALVSLVEVNKKINSLYQDIRDIIKLKDAAAK